MENSSPRTKEEIQAKESATGLSQKGAMKGTKPEEAKEFKQFSITIGQEPEVVFAFWRDFQNLAHFMKDLESVQILSTTRSHWVTKLKSDLKFEWDAEIVNETPGKMISWRSVGDSTIKTSGSVWFEKAPAGRGTVVRLSMGYQVPGGKLGELAGKFTGEDPYNLTLTNLKRLKAYLETGEIATTEGQPSGRDEVSKDAELEYPTLH